MSHPAERLRADMHAAWRSAFRSNWKLLAGISLAWLALTALITQLPVPGWEKGFFAGLILMAAVALTALTIFEASGARYLYLGQLGERFTAAAISGWRQRRQGWRVVHNLYFAGHGDVDHVLVGSGAVSVLESKMRSATDSWEVRDSRLLGNYSIDALAQARRGARKVEAALTLGRNRLDVQVRPVLVVWGPGAPVIEGGSTMVDGVLVCDGRQERLWRRELTGRLDRGVTDAALALLLEMRERSEHWHREHQADEPSR